MHQSTASQSTKSQHGNAGASATHSNFGGDDQENPFALPSDELIFSFKETEKDRKIIEREKNKQLRVWEKNRPTREGCLRKICETDIEPTQLAINPKVQSKVNVAEAAGFTIPIERPKNRENRWQLIDKKREIGLVQQMLEVKQTEIERLAEMATMREDGLTCSENMLETDTHLFINFFNRIKQQTQDASKTLDETRRIKNDKVNEFKNITEKIQILQSNVSKNVEYLDDYKKYKDFLDSLYLGITNKEEQDIIKQKKERKQLRFQVKKRQREEEERLIIESLKAQGIDEPPQSLEQELQINEQLQEIYEDSDSESPERFTDPEDLMNILTTLEDSNLMQIQRMQQSEEHLETRRQEKVKQEKMFERLIRDLQNNQDTNNSRIQNNIKDRDALLTLDKDDNVDSLPHDLDASLLDHTRKLFIASKPDTQRHNDQEEAKLNNMSKVAMLNEVEQMILQHLEEFEEYEKTDHDGFRLLKKEIRKKELENNQKERKENEEEKRKLYKLMKEQDNLRRKGKLFGKMPMIRSQPPKVKKVEKKKQKYTTDQQDMIDYGLQVLVDLETVQKKAEAEEQ